MCLHHQKLKTINKIITFVYEDYLFIMKVFFLAYVSKNFSKSAQEVTQ